MQLASIHRAMKNELTRIERASRIVLALLVGTLIWSTAIDEESFSVEERLPLILNLPVEYIIIENLSDSVLVGFNGSGREMLDYQVGSLTSEVRKNIQTRDLHFFPADLTVELSLSDVHSNGLVTASEIIPGQIPITIDTIISRSLPVSVITSDGIPSRFRFISSEPAFITVTGPSSVVNSMDSVATEELSVTSGHIVASLAFRGTTVAYSEEVVEVQIIEPLVPVMYQNSL